MTARADTKAFGYLAGEFTLGARNVEVAFCLVGAALRMLPAKAAQKTKDAGRCRGALRALADDLFVVQKTPIR